MKAEKLAPNNLKDLSARRARLGFHTQRPGIEVYKYLTIPWKSHRRDKTNGLERNRRGRGCLHLETRTESDIFSMVK
jgi:hypothetical protein